MNFGVKYSDINENLPLDSLFEVLYDLWQIITAMTCVMTDHVSFRSNIIKSFEWLLL